MPGLPGVNVALPERASQTVASGLMRNLSAVGTSLVTSGFFVAIVTVAYILMRKAITAWRKQHLMNQVGNGAADGLAIAYAQRAYTAMISGYAWWNDVFGDGTDEEALYQVAREMRQNSVPFALVASKYKTLYGRELINDLTSELDSAQLGKFNAILNTGLGGLGAAPDRHQRLVTTAATPVFGFTGEQLVPLGELPANMLLGVHSHTLMGRDGQIWHGFDYQNQVRLVPSGAVASLPL